MKPSKPTRSTPLTINIMVGVLALQGAFKEHCRILKTLGVTPVEVRQPKQLSGLQGLIIPGGESTTISHLLTEYGLDSAICHHVKKNAMALWGTCAGAILMAKKIQNPPTAPQSKVQCLNLIDIVVERNTFGSQINSFTQTLKAKPFKTPFLGVFIRAPIITQIGPSVEKLATLKDTRIVAVQEKNRLATVFHPELTQDDRWHRYFLNNLINDAATKQECRT